MIPIEPLFYIFPYSLSPDSLKGRCLRATSADHMKQLNAPAGGAKQHIISEFLQGFCG